jgi:sugar-specific transcriptional regulator TrmB
MPHQLLQKIGLSDNESHVYLTLLRLGSVPISSLAKQAEIGRTSLYPLVDKLKKMRLLESYNRFGKKYVRCTPVEQLQNIMDVQKRELEQTQTLLDSTFPILKAEENKTGLRPKVRFFEDAESLPRIYDEICMEQDIYTIFNPKALRNIFPQYLSGVADSLKKHGGRAKELLVPCPEALEYKATYQSPQHEIKLFPKTEKLQTDTIITSGKIFLFSYGNYEVSGVEIQNKTQAQAQRIIFEQLWDLILPEENTFL